ncbi:MAG: type VII toxin-antitoxin system MntA family adenylyltransferase antitoxin [Thermoleophilia bacterium]
MDARFNITMPAEFAEAVDERARLEHRSRSGLIREALKSFMRGPGGGEQATASAIHQTEGGQSAELLPSVETLADRLRAFCVGQDDIVAAYLFGSAAAGRPGPLSDVDVAVLLDAPEAAAPERIAGSRQADLSARLPTALGAPRVDVVILNSAPAALAFRVVGGGRVVVGGDSPERVRFEVALLRRYVDYLPLEREYTRSMRERVSRGDLVAR